MSVASAAAVDSMVSVIPVMVVGDMTMAMTERFFNSQTGRQVRRRRSPAQRRRQYRRRVPAMGIGDFSNVGF